MKKTMKSSYHDTPALWKDLLQAGLEDDGWPWDWTTLGTARAQLRARVVAKSDGIWAASGLVRMLPGMASELLGGEGEFRVSSRYTDGAALKKGDLVCEWKGPARAVLALERPFLNLASYVSGVATATNRLVRIVEKRCPRRTPRVTATRKTLPGYRDLAIHGVIAGGGFSHRVSLSGGVLIKENHIAAAGGVLAAIEGARAVAPHLLKIEVEVRSLKELDQAIRASADAVLLDNFTPADVVKALGRVAEASSRPVIEVSGGLNEESVAAYALPGVDVLSVGALTHSVKAVDLSLLVD